MKSPTLKFSLCTYYFRRPRCNYLVYFSVRKNGMFFILTSSAVIPWGKCREHATYLSRNGLYHCFFFLISVFSSEPLRVTVNPTRIPIFFFS